MKLSRRDFLKLVAALGAGATLEFSKVDLIKIFAAAKEDYWHIAWLNAATCTGCAVSFAQATDPDVLQVLMSIMVGTSRLPIALPDYMQVLHPASGGLAGTLYREVWKKAPAGRRILVVEGATQEEGWCLVSDVVIGGKGLEHIDFREWLTDAAKVADYVVAFGSCAAYGGIPHAIGNPTGAMGVQDFFEKEGIEKLVINLPRCPGHPDSLVQTLAAVIAAHEAGIKVTDLVELDKYGRPTAFFGMNMHEARCPYRPYYDTGVFVQKPGEYPAPPAEEGCRWRVGCKGPIAFTDCALRKWNDHVSYCVEVGAPCIGCSEPEFPDGNTAPFYVELPGLPAVLGIPVTTWGQVLVAISAIGCAIHFARRVMVKKKSSE